MRKLRDVSAHEPTRHGKPIQYADGASMNVESLDGLVYLVTRAIGGTVVSGVELTATEAQQLAQSLFAAVVAANRRETEL